MQVAADKVLFTAQRIEESVGAHHSPRRRAGFDIEERFRSKLARWSFPPAEQHFRGKNCKRVEKSRLSIASLTNYRGENFRLEKLCVHHLFCVCASLSFALLRLTRAYCSAMYVFSFCAIIFPVKKQKMQRIIFNFSLSVSVTLLFGRTKKTYRFAVLSPFCDTQ